MRYNRIHPWNVSSKKAVELQKKIAGEIQERPVRISGVTSVAGVDVSVRGDTCRAAVVVLSFPGLRVIETVTHTEKVKFPYVPGLLSFREAPSVLKCVLKLRREPDVFIFDGQGKAHPRGTGIAAHLGLFLGKPSVGCAKSRLYGVFSVPGTEKGSYSPLKDPAGRDIGAVLRTRTGVKPVFISPGHLADIPSSVRLVLECCKTFKLPETTRAAHKAASLSSRNGISGNP
ncbi:MAG: endonuclease V [Candidatus Omnitrophica bacterium]|nr:endonuclease V [Candidatus Omnitrophota bacterium]